MVLYSTVAEAFQLGTRIANPADAYDQIVTAGSHAWRLTDSEWNEMLACVRAALAALGAASREPDMTDAEVRFLASAWHGGQWAPLYALSSTGSIVDGVLREIQEALADCDDFEMFMSQAESEEEAIRLQATERRQLLQLRDYCAYHGLRGPQACWSTRS